MIRNERKIKRILMLYGINIYTNGDIELSKNDQYLPNYQKNLMNRIYVQSSKYFHS